MKKYSFIRFSFRRIKIPNDWENDNISFKNEKWWNFTKEGKMIKIWRTDSTECLFFCVFVVRYVKFIYLQNLEFAQASECLFIQTCDFIVIDLQTT